MTASKPQYPAATASTLTEGLSSDMYISVYNTCTLLLSNEKYVDSNLDAPDNVISGNISNLMAIH